MNFLAFDTSTERLSLAVGRGEAVWQQEGAGGAQSSATLIPALLALLAQAGLTLQQLDAIVFGSGPGSFTGLRTACSVAQGLAFGANLKVLPIDTLLAVAEEARFQQASALAHWQVLALLDARMDEMYAASYAFNSGKWKQIKGYSLIRPEDLASDADCPLAGNVFASYGARLPGVAPRIEALPGACALLRLAPALLADGGAVPAGQALPLYIRDKVAKTTLERATEKAAL